MKRNQPLRKSILDRWHLPYLILLVIYGFSVGYQATTHIRFNYDKGLDFNIFTKYATNLLTPFVKDAIIKNNKYKKHRITKLNLYKTLKSVNGQLKGIYMHIDLIGYNPNYYKIIKDCVDKLKNYRTFIYFNLNLLEGLTYDEFNEANNIGRNLGYIISDLENPEQLKNTTWIQKNVKDLHNSICDFFKLNEKFVNKEFDEFQRASMFRKIG